MVIPAAPNYNQMRAIDVGHWRHNGFDVYLAEHPKLSGKYEIYSGDQFVGRANTLKSAKSMAKKLKIWNGRGHGKYTNGHIYVAAYSVAQACRLISMACQSNVTPHEIKVYYSRAWGRPMAGIEPTEPCLYAEGNFGEPPIKII